jgi:hypothetical protein
VATPFPLTGVEPNDQKDSSGNSDKSRIIDNNGKHNKKRVDFSAKYYLNRLT